MEERWDRMKKAALETNHKIFCCLHFFLKNFFLLCLVAYGDKCRGPSVDTENESVEIIGSSLLPQSMNTCSWETRQKPAMAVCIMQFRLTYHLGKAMLVATVTGSLSDTRN